MALIHLPSHNTNLAPCTESSYMVIFIESTFSVCRIMTIVAKPCSIPWSFFISCITHYLTSWIITYILVWIVFYVIITNSILKFTNAPAVYIFSQYIQTPEYFKEKTLPRDFWPSPIWSGCCVGSLTATILESPFTMNLWVPFASLMFDPFFPKFCLYLFIGLSALLIKQNF